MVAIPAQKVEMIPISRITVVNPRLRNKKQFKEIIDNIGQIGLKRPITVTRRMEASGPYYDLVCGQGRLEAFKALGQETVPALVVSANAEDCLIASLVENCARRQHRSVDLLRDIGEMKKRGHTVAKIALMTDLSTEYVYAVIRLLEQGEERLLRAVEVGQIPFSVALDIAEAEDHDIQAALQSAYERKLLRGKKLMTAKRLVEQRRQQGKGLRINGITKPRPMSSERLLQTFQDDVDRKRILIRRAEAAKARLTFVTQAIDKLLRDDRFSALLLEEGLTSLPDELASRLNSKTGGKR
ncbi:ParB N-terminal domain-containing protein [Agrobacterium vitis]|uniref:Chromosome partitioning protein ParB n=1 Tax=Agrobacterium vitis TaxID=373 RepID=A0A368NR57_AGRVI|nr:plasmid partitioning protein RepB C-terminal domain-containing protein [Agrobacterium vitis]KAA3516996.1 chromosome partitioning protein ParB [Agrobacterium vitis]KAA3529761.1 chromosome partitioning protein ParB [Agrobacterium vitis]MCF1477241.1 chromosome partitioning protein ParB [Agrobacterium vitis]MVA27973.1 chromosome partitioning protein ParB [Agrobacterium vitis]NOJ36262.1 ParB N-terminal domain-containing protein [Agrobacterium vitis]